MNPFVARFKPGSDQWVWPVAGVCVVLGFMFSTAWVTNSNRQSRLNVIESGMRGRISEGSIDIDSYEQTKAEVTQLRAENTNLQNTLAKGTSDSKASKVLNDELQDTKLFAGLTPVEGQGVVVTLSDSAHGGVKLQNETVMSPEVNIHDTDVLAVVNELYSAGAEAIAINGHRISVCTSIRCVGSTILVDDAKVASPIAIAAIGDAPTLVGALNLNGGVLSGIRETDSGMVQIEAERNMKLDPYSGRTNYKVAKLPRDTK